MEFVMVRDPVLSSEGSQGERKNMREKDEVLRVYYLGPQGKGLWGWDVV